MKERKIMDEENILMNEFSTVNSQQMSGDGTEENPFLIADIESFIGIRDNLSGCYKLVADLDLAGVTLEPIGDIWNPFTGTFDGNGYVIRNLHMERRGGYTGLFGYAEGATFRDFKVEDLLVQISAGMYTGGFVGYLDNCNMENIYLERVIVKGGECTGGLAGYVKGGIIIACCSIGDVVGSHDVGGLIGVTTSTSELVVKDSFARGTVASDRSSYYVAGLIGAAYRTTVKNCYAACNVSKGGEGLLCANKYTKVESSCFDSLAAGFSTHDEYNVGYLTTALLQKKFFKDWDFKTIWGIEEGVCYPYPRKAGRMLGGIVDKGEISAGIGTEEDPYQIRTAEGLNCIRYALSGCYKLMEDLDFTGKTIEPVGTLAEPFVGIFDGNGHVVRNLHMERRGDYIGLFGCASDAKLKNLKLENCKAIQLEVRGYTGIFAGYLNNCITENIGMERVDVKGKQYTGGLAGYVKDGSVAGCYVIGDVTGSSDVGGLVGATSATLELFIKDSFARGIVTTYSNNSSTGGLIGYAYRTTVRNCYAAGSVSERGSGLLYASSYTKVESSYFDSLVAGFGTQNRYNIGCLTSALLRKGFFMGWDFNTVWEIEEGVSYPYLKNAGKPSEIAVDAGEIAEGCGTEEDPYQIRTVGGFGYINYDLSGCYKLMSDLDFIGKNVESIGSKNTPFTGKLNGNGHTIKKIEIKKEVRDSDYVGLFGHAYLAKFNDLRLEDCVVKHMSTGIYTGGFVGYMRDCTANYIWLKNIIVSGNRYIGGLAGYMYNSITENVFIENVDVKGDEYIGGLTGCMEEGKGIGCGVNGTIVGTRYVGGLIGKTASTSELNLANCFVNGNITSVTSGNYTGGLVGYPYNTSINNCYVVGNVRPSGSGLSSGYVTITSSYFDSTVSGITTPTTQARTTEQMLDKETYVDWDWDNIWDYKTNSYPVLMGIEAITREPFELTAGNTTCFSVALKWADIPRAERYEISYRNRVESSVVPEVQIKELDPDTEYEFRVCAVIDETTRVWSKTIKIRTKKLLSIERLHASSKVNNSITLTWNPVENAESYQVIYNDEILNTDKNTCTLTDLAVDRSYEISVKAITADGSVVLGTPIVEKIYSIVPQTDYAEEFIAKCEGQNWFLDEIENILNLKGKSINSITSQRDFACIYAIGLANRGISGKIPAAIGELRQLQYLYLANNNLNGEIPDEIRQLDRLVEADFSGNDLKKTITIE